MLTFSDLKTSSLRKIAQTCPSSDDFADLVNQATRRLMRRGDWPGTVVPIYVCAMAGCVVWPHYVGQVRRLNICSQPISIRSMWYEFLPGVRQCGDSSWRQTLGPLAGLAAQGRTSVFQDIQGEGRLVRAYPRCTTDFGKIVRIFGLDNNGQTLQTDNQDGTFSAGLKLILGAPYATTATYVRSIDYVLKDETQCPVDMYAYNASTDLLEDLAHYEAGETRPSYEKTKLILQNYPNPCSGTTSTSPACCGTARGVVALVKLRFVPVKADTDLVLIDNEDALKLMVQSILKHEAGDRKGALEYKGDAVRELNRELEDVSPDEQLAAVDNVLGPYTFSQQCF